LPARETASSLTDRSTAISLNLNTCQQETNMSGVVVTAHIKDSAKWEKGFRAHGELFRRNNISLIHYTITKSNDVVMYSETDDVDAYLNFVRSPDVVRAMADDGVEGDTVKVFALEKELKPS
jgi:hypothetical protein